jgi:hypothetical protein
MRRALVLALLALAAIAPAASAGPSFTLTSTHASFLAVDRSLWVQVHWTPSTASTDVTVVVKQGSHTLKTLEARNWLVGAKTFTFAVPRSVADGGVLSVRVKATSSAGNAATSLTVPVR